MLGQRREFLVLFPNCTGSPRYVCRQLLKGNGENSSIHSAIWKFFLVVAPSCKDHFARSGDWIEVLKQRREKFYQLKSELFVKPPEDDQDPLAVAKSDEWAEYFKDQDLRRKIRQDTKRTFQEVEYFQEGETLNILEDMLFLFCKAHPDYGYPQGLHELAAVILYVFHNEMMSEDSDTLGFIFNKGSVIPDTYWTFTGLAEKLEPLYRATSDGETFGILFANSVQNEKLKAHSPALAEALAKNKVAPQSYMMPWLRLLFLRVFDLEGIINMWDIIFAHLQNLAIVADTCVAMLLEQEKSLLKADATTMLRTLYRYPATGDGMRFALKAVELEHTISRRRLQDTNSLVAERLNELARGLESVCQGHGFEDAIPYIMDLRRTRDILLGVLDVEEMLPLEQALELFKPVEIESTVIPETQETPVLPSRPEQKASSLPKAGNKDQKVSDSVLFDEESPVSTKKRAKAKMRQARASELFG